MKVAIVHDYIKEFGGAERVLEALCEIFPDAPIYTAFYDKKGTAYGHFKNKKIIPSWAQNIPFFTSKLHSPLRFLAPLIWGSFKDELQKYDVIISSASWYVTKGFGSRCHPELVSGSPVRRQASLRSGEMLKPVQHDIKKKPIEICYCHTPPRWLYGYTTSVNFQKYLPVKIYAAIVGHFMRLYDFKAAQKVDYFIANSQEVAGRIKKFYRRDSTVIYPPVGLDGRGLNVEDSNLKIENRSSIHPLASSVKNPSSTFHRPSSKDYYLIVSRIVGAKGLEIAITAAEKMGIKLKIAGTQAGYYTEYKNYSDKNKNIQFLGHVTDAELVDLYRGAKAFLALAKDEDFGITPVEAMSVGTPVIAFNGGGYKETIVQNKTGLLFDDYSVDGLISAIKKFESSKFNPKDCINQAQKFSKERFKKEIMDFVKSKIK